MRYSETLEYEVPKYNNMPDISHLDGKIILLLAIKNLTGSLPTNSKARALLINYVRLISKLIREYQITREYLQNFVDSGSDLLPFLNCISHMENCIITLKRAIDFARKIRKCKELTKIDRILPILSNVNSKETKDLRDVITHLDDRIHCGQIDDAKTIILNVQSDYVEFAGTKLSYQNLANCIDELYKVANDLISNSKPIV